MQPKNQNETNFREIRQRESIQHKEIRQDKKYKKNKNIDINNAELLELILKNNHIYHTKCNYYTDDIVEIKRNGKTYILPFNIDDECLTEFQLEF